MQRATSKDGTQIAFDVTGRGPALIFISGAICFRKFLPILQDVKVLSSEFTVYNYDRRGRGDSGDASVYETGREVEDIEAIIDAAGGKAFIYGHSSGAVLALEAALRYPHKVSKVAIYDASYVHDQTERISFELLGQKVMAHLSAGSNARALREFLIGIGMPKVFVYALPLMPGWKTMKALAPTLAYDIELTRDLPPIDRLAKIGVPVRIMHGEKNPAGIKAVAETLRRALPTSEILEIKGQDHMVGAKVLLPLLSNFFKD